MSSNIKTAHLGIRISVEEKDRLVRIAEKRDIPVSQLVREIIKAWCQEEK